MKKYQKLGLVLAMGLGATGAANAAILFDNTVPLHYDSALPISSGDWAEGAFTTPGSCLPSCSLNNISLVIRTTSSIYNPVDMGLTIWSIKDVHSIGSLTSDSGGILPVSLAAAASSFTPTSTISLAANATYWVRLTNLDINKYIEWAYVNGNGSLAYYDHTSPPFQDYSGAALLMKVTGTPVSAVPIPASAWLFGSAMLGLVKSWRRKKG